MHRTLIFLLTVISSSLFGQALTVSQTQLNFGNTFETVPDSLQLTITNPSTSAVDVNGIRFYKVYGQIPFSVRDSVFNLQALASKTIWIKFSPIHNVPHNCEMVILNNSHRGNVSIDLIGQGKYSKNYYSHTENLTEQTLKDTLQAITGRGYMQQGYNGGRDKMFMNVDNKKVNGQAAAVNTIECVYTGRNAVGYTSRSNCQSAYSFNTEHTYPQTYFGSVEPMLSDLHHLYPTDDNANSIRSSYRFGMVTGTPTWTDGGSKFALPFFEPRDQHKGEVARAMFYFVVRYQNYMGFLTTQESTLRAWLHAFPPSTIEKKRDVDIFAYQKNHNPFIDYPQLVDRITSISNTSVAPIHASLDLTDSVIDFGIVTPGNNYVYNYVMVNKGNTPLNFSNLSLSNSTLLSFTNGTGANASLQPGETLNLKININTLNSDSILEFLNFDTSLPNSFTFAIPIIANFYNPPLAVHQVIANPELLIYPNPSTGQLYIKYNLNGAINGLISIYDVLGKSIFSSTLIGSENAISLDLSEFDKGIYTCRLQAGNGIEYKKLVLIK